MSISNDPATERLTDIIHSASPNWQFAIEQVTLGKIWSRLARHLRSRWRQWQAILDGRHANSKWMGYWKVSGTCHEFPALSQIYSWISLKNKLDSIQYLKNKDQSEPPCWAARFGKFNVDYIFCLKSDFQRIWNLVKMEMNSKIGSPILFVRSIEKLPGRNQKRNHCTNITFLFT